MNITKTKRTKKMKYERHIQKTTKKLDGERFLFRDTFVRYGEKPGQEDAREKPRYW